MIASFKANQIQETSFSLKQFNPIHNPTQLFFFSAKIVIAGLGQFPLDLNHLVSFCLLIIVFYLTTQFNTSLIHH
jgi:hypothetical protein